MGQSLSNASLHTHTHHATPHHTIREGENDTEKVRNFYSNKHNVGKIISSSSSFLVYKESSKKFKQSAYYNSAMCEVGFLI